MKAIIESEMPRHLEKWGSMGGENWGTMSIWNQNVAILEDFANNRIPYVLQFFSERFDFHNSMAEIELNVAQPGAGKIKLNSIILDEYPWCGTYFKDVPVQITALPELGYKFAGWTGITPADSISTTIVLSNNLIITALFEQKDNPETSLVINEVNYNSSDDFNPDDWVELYNPNTFTVDLSGWMFKDEDDIHIFNFPEGFILDSEEYIVLCRDTTAFLTFFPEVTSCLGNLDFGLSGNGELIRLYDSQGTLVDFFTYDDEDPWPVEPDGNGPALALINPSLDNTVAENWAPSVEHGTPGELNEVDIVGIADLSTPGVFYLGQNYPNPFNPTTTINFSIPENEYVNLVIYNIMGQQICELAAETMDAGTHFIVWNGRDNQGNAVSSGVYILRLQSGERIATKKMLLMK